MIGFILYPFSYIFILRNDVSCLKVYCRCMYVSFINILKMYIHIMLVLQTNVMAYIIIKRTAI